MLLLNKSAPLYNQAGGSLLNVFRCCCCCFLFIAVRHTRFNRVCVIVIKLVFKFWWPDGGFTLRFNRIYFLKSVMNLEDFEERLASNTRDISHICINWKCLTEVHSSIMLRIATLLAFSKKLLERFLGMYVRIHVVSSKGRSACCWV